MVRYMCAMAINFATVTTIFRLNFETFDDSVVSFVCFLF